ncbi:DUF7504 family protein [Natronorubrum tibetense]|uniref:DUF7504 family protein n=1 Tax=Natronorubrum tibetense TaxID=63128 RepID=UPI001268C4F7|nr:hypothetical protein [Natronorubrum tibetense]
MTHFKTDDWTTTESLIDFDGIPDTISSSSTLCIAKPAPLTEHALPMRITNRYADRGDCRIIVTSSAGAEETIRQQKAIEPLEESRIGVVDTTANDYLAALYQENPTISLPHSRELTQLSLAVWDLHETLSEPCEKTHIIIQSLTPILAEGRLESVINVLERWIEQQRATSSLTVFSIEYTEHDEATMVALERLVDGIVWVEQTERQKLRLDYQRARGREQ